MSVVSAVLPSARSRGAGRLAPLFVLVVAVVAGLTSGVARAADTGGFTPIDFSQAPPPSQPVGVTPVTGGLTFSGPLQIDGLDPATPPDVANGLVTTLTFDTPGRPVPGQAHLFSRTSGIAPMTDAQYAGMVAMENDAVRTVMAAHGISDNAVDHDLVVKYAREDVTVSLYARLQQALTKDAAVRTGDEQQALTWLAAVAQAHALGVALEAKHQYDLWDADDCAYRPPAPYDDYVGNQAAYCLGVKLMSPLPFQRKPPTKEQFLTWGAAAYDAARTGGQTVQMSAFTSSVSEWAIAFGAGAGFFGAATGVGLTANLLNVGGFGAGPLTQAVFPYFAAGIRMPSILVTRFGTPTAVRLLSTAISTATRFAGVANFLVVLGPALIIASAIVSAVLAGIDAFAEKNTISALDAAVDNARSNQPDLRGLLGTADGQRQVFGDLAGSVINCAVAYSAPGECDIDATMPTRRADDPVFQVTDVDTGETADGVSVSAPVSLGRPGAWSDTRLSIRDGWFVRDDSSEPTQTMRYTDLQGKPRTAHLLHRADGGYYFQSLLEPTAPNSSVGTGYDSAADCTSGNIYQPCFTSTSIPMRTSSGRNVYLSMAADRAPTAPVLGTNRPAAVGLPVQLAATLPPGAQADPDGDAVTSSWAVEFDKPCVQTDPANYSWDCSTNGSTPNGPHGGYLFALPAGADTVVWNTAGTYRVTRTVTDPTGLSTTVPMDVVVAPAPRTLFATCLRCDTTGGRQVQIAGRIQLGASRDSETVTVDWGDGTTTSGVPRQARPGNEFLSPQFWAKIENSAQYQFQAVHTYAAGAGNPYRITVTDTDTGDGNPSPVLLSADTAPAADPTSYENVVSDRLVDYQIPVRLPVFTDRAGNHPTVACTAADGAGGTRSITDFSTFPTGTTTTVTCRAAAASGVTGTATFTVQTHQITAHLVAAPSPAVVGQPVTYTATGTTDDGRDIGDVTARITVQSEADGTTCSQRTCIRTTTSGPIVASPMADDNHVGDAVSTPVLPDLAAAITVVDGADQTLPVNTALRSGFSFIVRDGYGNPRPNTPVTLSVASGTGTLPGGGTTAQVLTDTAGKVLFGGAVGGTPGPVVFKATVNDDVVAQFTATATAGDGLRGVSGNAQRVRVGATATPLVTRLYDGNLAPLPGQPIRVQVVRGPARFADGTTSVSGTTDAAGKYSAPLAAAATPGTTTFLVTADGDTTLLATYYVANAAPVAGPAAAYTVTAGTGGLRPEGTNGVLNGIVDADGDPLTAAVVAKPKNGVLTLAANGSFTYLPRSGFSGTDSFSFTASDGLLTTAPQVVTLQVRPATADIAVTMAGAATVARGKTAAIGVYVTNQGPSSAGTVSMSVRLPTGLSFGTVPDGVALSTDRRTATYLVSHLGNGLTKRLNLQVKAATDASVGAKTVRSASGTALLPDSTSTNNTFAARMTVT